MVGYDNKTKGIKEIYKVAQHEREREKERDVESGSTVMFIFRSLTTVGVASCYSLILSARTQSAESLSGKRTSPDCHRVSGQ